MPKKTYFPFGVRPYLICVNVSFRVQHYHPHSSKGCASRRACSSFCFTFSKSWGSNREEKIHGREFFGETKLIFGGVFFVPGL